MDFQKTADDLEEIRGQVHDQIFAIDERDKEVSFSAELRRIVDWTRENTQEIMTPSEPVDAETMELLAVFNESAMIRLNDVHVPHDSPKSPFRKVVMDRIHDRRYVDDQVQRVLAHAHHDVRDAFLS